MSAHIRNIIDDDLYENDSCCASPNGCGTFDFDIRRTHAATAKTRTRECKISTPNRRFPSEYLQFIDTLLPGILCIVQKLNVLRIMMRSSFLLLVTLVTVATSAFAQERSTKFSGNLNFEGSGGDYITSDRVYAFTAETGTFSVALSQDRRTLTVNYEDFVAPGEVFSKNWFHVEFQAIQGYTLRTGKYKSASRYPFNSNNVDYSGGDVPSKITNRNGFNISGNGRGCNQLTADFEIKSIEISEVDGQILKFEAQFTQHCENGVAYATGTVVLNRDQNAEVKIQLN